MTAADECTRVWWCAGMTMALYGTPENHEGKGLSESRGWLGDEKAPRKIGVTYRTKARADALILNFCPWCGKRIRFDETAEAGR